MEAAPLVAVRLTPATGTPGLVVYNFGGGGTGNFKLKVQFTNYLPAVQTITFTWPDSVFWDHASASTANGWTGTVANGNNFGMFYDTTGSPPAQTVSVSVPASGTTTIERPYLLSLWYQRRAVPYTDRLTCLFVQMSASSLTPVTIPGTFAGNYTQTVTGPSGPVTTPKTYAIPLPLELSSGPANVVPSSHTLNFNFGGPATPDSETGVAKIVWNVRGAMAAGNKVSVVVKADPARGLAAQTFEIATTLEKTGDSISQYVWQHDNPTGDYTDRDIQLTITSGDGKKTLITKVGHTPQWSGAMTGGDPPQPDYGYVYQLSSNAVGLVDQPNPDKETPGDPNEGLDDIKAQDGLGNEAGEAQKLGENGSLGKNSLTGLTGTGKGVGTGPGGGSGNFTGSSATYSFAVPMINKTITMDLSQYQPWVGIVRNVMTTLLYVFGGVQTVLIMRGTSANS